LNKDIINNIFFTYSIYSDQQKIKDGNYNSKYWDPLLDKTDIKDKSFFFNIYFQKDKKILMHELLNLRKTKNKNRIFFVEQLFNFKIFFKIIFVWFRQIFKTISLRSILFKYLKQNNFFYLKSYVYKDYLNSFIGLPSLTNLYYFYIFQNISKKLNNAKKVFYLYENQGWEKIMNFHFNNNYETFAVNHASIRFWDLRFSQYKNEPNGLKPDFYLVNGDDSLKKLLKFGYPEIKLKKVEALRYYELSKKLKHINFKNKFRNNVLIVSDAFEIANKSIANCLNYLNDEIIRDFTFTLKEHPIRKFNQKIKVNLKRTNYDLLDLKKKHDIVIVSNTTSAIVDLHLLDYKIICPIDFDTFNLSPLAYDNKILFLDNYSKINQILLDLINNDNNISKKKDFFYFQENLNFWRSIIKYD
jgi:surface carbohydrate biosynthesis protein (TIGR04326 family)